MCGFLKYGYSRNFRDGVKMERGRKKRDNRFLLGDAFVVPHKHVGCL